MSLLWCEPSTPVGTSYLKLVRCEQQIRSSEKEKRVLLAMVNIILNEMSKILLKPTRILDNSN